MIDNFKPQTPSVPENWLHNEAQDYTRVFSKLVYLPLNAEPWPECTNEEKEQWEAEHPHPEPEIKEEQQ